jgi:hypothetical protein
MPSPQLVIRRVVVSGELTLDQSFDRGLNVLYAAPARGDARLTNKAGKTALVELIQYGLGRRQRRRETFHFEPIMDRLGSLWLEVEANGMVATVERSMRDIFARVVLRDGPYQPRSSELPGDLVDVEALSGRLLGMLNIPEVSVKTLEGDLFPLSFPTLMRAFVLHQDDSFGGILNKVQPERRKTDVLGFLTRIIPVRAYGLEERLAGAQRRLQTVTASRDAVRAYLHEHGMAVDGTTLDEAETRLAEARAALATAVEARRAAQVALQSRGRDAPPGTPLPDAAAPGTGRTDRLRAELLDLKAKRSTAERDVAVLRQEAQRLRDLVGSLRGDAQRVERLRSASAILSTVDFDMCPRCLQELTADMRQREAYARCALCNRTLSTTSDHVPRATPDPTDIAAQLDEAEAVLRDVEGEEGEGQKALSALREREASAERALDAESAAYVAPAVDRLLALSYEVGEREGALAEAAALARHAGALRDMQREIDELTAQQATLQDELAEAARRSARRVRRLEALYRDILVQVGFPSLRSVQVAQGSLMPYINGSLYTHQGAALAGLATVCYHLALLRLSIQVGTYFPRMLVIDSPAVGDLNEQNHAALLDYLAAVQEGAWEPEGSDRATNPDWQIILTTRRLTPRLEPYKVMEISSEPRRMLLRPSAVSRGSSAESGRLGGTPIRP